MYERGFEPLVTLERTAPPTTVRTRPAQSVNFAVEERSDFGSEILRGKISCLAGCLGRVSQLARPRSLTRSGFTRPAKTPTSRDLSSPRIEPLRKTGRILRFCQGGCRDSFVPAKPSRSVPVSLPNREAHFVEQGAIRTP